MSANNFWNKVPQALLKNLGLISFVIGAIFQIFGLFNLGILPHFYESLTGSASIDGMMNLIINGLFWMGLCIFLMLIGVKFYISSDNVPKLQDQWKKNKYSLGLYFYLVGAVIHVGMILYLILLLTNILSPLQFFPNVLFAGHETPMDLSILLNAVFFILIINIIYRIGGEFIKYSVRIGG